MTPAPVDGAGKAPDVWAMGAHTREDPAQGTADTARPLGVYVHFPFCGRRCPYCDFAIDVRTDIPHERYAAAVMAEVSARAAWFRGPAAPQLVSVYFGGGTPGLWKAVCVGHVLHHIAQAFSADVAALEVTVEANPGEVTVGHLEDLRRQGVNRLSLGVQSFDAPLLATLGRSHSDHDALAGIAVARQAGFANVAADLMFGLPGQSLTQWDETLDQMAALAPDHVSAYALTVEPFTPFGQRERKGLLHRPDDDAVAAMFERAHERLERCGYTHYEVSSYARAARQAVHNGLYWSQGSYLGVGCAAASFRPLASGGGFRFTNPRATDTYLRAAEAGGGHVHPASVEWRPPHDLEAEALWLGLRTLAGVDRTIHARLFGRDPLAHGTRADVARQLERAGWLQVDARRLWPTAAGLQFADEMATRLWG